MIAADHPDRAVIFQDTSGRGEPFARESVIGREAVQRIAAFAGELVPGIVDAVDLRVVRSVKITCELQVIGRIGKNDVDRTGRQ